MITRKDIRKISKMLSLDKDQVEKMLEFREKQIFKSNTYAVPFMNGLFGVGFIGFGVLSNSSHGRLAFALLGLVELVMAAYGVYIVWVGIGMNDPAELAETLEEF